jgi:hypothetical protein
MIVGMTEYFFNQFFKKPIAVRRHFDASPFAGVPVDGTGIDPQQLGEFLCGQRSSKFLFKFINDIHFSPSLLFF